MEITTNSAEETCKLAQQIARKLHPGNVLALYGDLGSGKTTFTGFLVRALGLPVRVQSPTFVIARKYRGEKFIVNHLDLYRLTSKSELVDIGIEDYINNPDEITIIEWPEIAEAYLPEKTIRIYFEYIGENERKIKIQNLY